MDEMTYFGLAIQMHDGDDHDTIDDLAAELKPIGGTL